jgi:hypothetical protein
LQKEGGQTALEQVLETLDRYTLQRKSFGDTLFIHLLIEFAQKIIYTMAEQNTLIQLLEDRCVEVKDKTILTILARLVEEYQTRENREIQMRCGGELLVGAILGKKNFYGDYIVENIASYVTGNNIPSISNEDINYFGFNKQHGGRLTKKSRNRKRINLKSKKQLKKSKHLKKRQNNKRKTKLRHR